MAYTAPSAADIKARFPEFAAVDDALITAVLAEAGSYVDQTWIEKDYAPAIQYWTAHTLVLEGLGTSTQAQLAAVGEFSQIKSGDLEVRRNSSASVAVADGRVNPDSLYTRTNYGQKFLELRGRNFPPVGII